MRVAMAIANSDLRAQPAGGSTCACSLHKHERTTITKRPGPCSPMPMPLGTACACSIHKHKATAMTKHLVPCYATLHYLQLCLALPPSSYREGPGRKRNRSCRRRWRHPRGGRARPEGFRRANPMHGFPRRRPPQLPAVATSAVSAPISAVCSCFALLLCSCSAPRCACPARGASRREGSKLTPRLQPWTTNSQPPALGCRNTSSGFWCSWSQSWPPQRAAVPSRTAPTASQSTSPKWQASCCKSGRSAVSIVTTSGGGAGTGE